MANPLLRLLPAAALVALAGGSAPQAAPAPEPGLRLTYADLADPPVRRLASELLGKAGERLVIDAGIVAFPTPGLHGIRASAPPPDMPVQAQEIIFYTQPKTAHAVGLCQATVIGVLFAAGDARGPTGLFADTRYGRVASPGPEPAYYTNDYDRRFAPVCARQPAGRDYFPAPDAESASRAARIIEALGQAGRSPPTQPLPFRYRCEDYDRKDCSAGRDELARMTVRRISAVAPMACAEEPKPRRRHSCYEISLQHPSTVGRMRTPPADETVRVSASFREGELTILSVEREKVQVRM